MAAARKTKTSPTTIALAEIPGMTKAQCAAYLDAAGIAFTRSAKVMDLRTLVHEHADRVTPGKAAPTTMARTRAKTRPIDLPTEKLTRAECIAELEANGVEAKKSMKVDELRAAVLRVRYGNTVETGQAPRAATKTKAKAKPAKPLTRGQQARARSVELNNHRGKGRKLTDAELTDYIVKVMKAHPESSCRAENEYAYWVEGIATGTARFARLWAEVEAETKPAKRTAKR